MPDEVIRMLPRTFMVSATLDILYQSQVEFSNRLRAQGVEVDCLEVVGLHQVKDMAQVTEAGRRVKGYIKEKSIEFVELATRRRGRNEGVMPRLKRQDTAVGLEVMASSVSVESSVRCQREQ